MFYEKMFFNGEWRKIHRKTMAPRKVMKPEIAGKKYIPTTENATTNIIRMIGVPIALIPELLLFFI